MSATLVEPLKVNAARQVSNLRGWQIGDDVSCLIAWISPVLDGVASGCHYVERNPIHLPGVVLADLCSIMFLSQNRLLGRVNEEPALERTVIRSCCQNRPHAPLQEYHLGPDRLGWLSAFAPSHVPENTRRRSIQCLVDLAKRRYVVYANALGCYPFLRTHHRFARD